MRKSIAQKKKTKVSKSTDPVRFTIEHLSPTDLKPHPKNYVTHPDDEITHIATSIQQHGFYKNIVIARDATILAGHGVVQAATKLGMVTVPVVRLDLDPDEPKALKVLSGDNEIRHLAEVDDYALTKLLLEIKDTDHELGLLGTGYDEMMLANLVFVSRPESEIKDKNQAAAWVGLPSYENAPDILKIVISFRSEEDRKAFIAKTKLQIEARDRNTATCWWPEKEREDPKSLKWKGKK
jgi:ParB-like chromosome segregation protein Spo0J